MDVKGERWLSVSNMKCCPGGQARYEGRIGERAQSQKAKTPYEGSCGARRLPLGDKAFRLNFLFGLYRFLSLLTAPRPTYAPSACGEASALILNKKKSRLSHKFGSSQFILLSFSPENSLHSLHDALLRHLSARAIEEYGAEENDKATPRYKRDRIHCRPLLSLSRRKP